MLTELTPGGPSGSPQAGWSVLGPSRPPFPVVTRVLFLHWWSPEAPSLARKPFPGTEGGLQRDGLSRWQLSLSFLPWQPRALAGLASNLVIATGPVPCDLRQAKGLFKQLHGLGWAVALCHLKTMKASLASRALACFKSCWLPGLG